jgi:multidrug efflux pump subunit AcrA (membrane-fusion protein)
MRIVKTGRTSGNTIEVLSGLADGDRIVTVGMDKAVDGGRLTSATPPAEKK